MVNGIITIEMHPWKWFREFLPHKLAIFLSGVPHVSLWKNVTGENLERQKEKTITKGWSGMGWGDEWQWLEVSNYIFQECSSLITRTLCGLLATRRPYREMPDMQNLWCSGSLAAFCAELIVLMFANSQKLYHRARWDRVHSIWSRLVIQLQFNQHLTNACVHSLGY